MSRHQTGKELDIEIGQLSLCRAFLLLKNRRRCMERGFKGVFIPADIWLNTELTASEKMLFAEIDSLDNEEGCYATNEYLASFCGVSVPTITRGIAKLKSLGYIEQVSFTGRTRILRVIKMIRQTNHFDESASSNCENLLLIENKKENNIKSTGAGALSKNHSQVYKKRESLNDDLESGKDIDKQKSDKRKSPKDKFKDECLDIIEKECAYKLYSTEVHDLLIQYFEFVSAVPLEKDNVAKRVKTVSVWKKKLDRLAELVEDEGYSPSDIIKQSLDKKQYVFYSLRGEYKASSKREGNQQNVQMSDPEWARQVIQKAIDNGEEFY
jgi:hypothetical protein